MFGARWQLFRILGVPINVDASWFLILALLTWNLITLIGAATPDLPAAAHWLLGLATALGFFACLVLHELGHALAARTVGVPIRGITLFLFGGVAEMGDEPPSAGSEFFVAVAGPAVSAALAGLFWLSALLLEVPAVAVPLRFLAGINAVVLLFNLVPAFPLDGGRVLRSALWAALGDLRRATYWASLSGVGFACALIGLGVLCLLGGAAFQGLWLCLIGMFLYSAARGSYQQVLVRQALRGEPVSRFMHRSPILVPPDLDLRRFVEDYVYRYHRKLFPVATDGRLAGVIGTQDLPKFPREEWGKRTVAEAMRPDVDALSISPAADALDALGMMQRTGSSRLLVREGDRLVGIVSLKDLLRFLNLKLELEKTER